MRLFPITGPLGIEQQHRLYDRRVRAAQRLSQTASLTSSSSNDTTAAKHATPKYVVSIATVASRLHTLDLVVGSALRLQPKPDRIIIWLDQRDRDIPLSPSLRRLTRHGLELRYVREIGPNKKWWYLSALPDLQEHAVVFLDDDVLVPSQPITLRLQHLSHDDNVIGFQSFAIHLAMMCCALHDGGDSLPELNGTRLRRIACDLHRRYDVSSLWPWLFSLHSGYGAVTAIRHLAQPVVRDLDAILRTCPGHDDAWVKTALLATDVTLRPDPSASAWAFSADQFSTFTADTGPKFARLTGSAVTALGQAARGVMDGVHHAMTSVAADHKASLLAKEHVQLNPYNDRNGGMAMSLAAIRHFRLFGRLQEMASQAEVPFTSHLLRAALDAPQQWHLPFQVVNALQRERHPFFRALSGLNSALKR